MITLFGTNTTHERLRKMAHRVTGTVVGAVAGILLLHLIGPGHVYWTLLVIVAAMSIGSWGMQRRYAYWVIGLVIALVQLYGLTTPYGGMDWLLTERLMDNTLGILVATACAALVFPISTREVAREAAHGYLAALDQLVTQVAERWQDPQAPVRLRGTARTVDAALHQLHSAARPLFRMPFGNRSHRADEVLSALVTATGHARALATAADVDTDLAPELRARIGRAAEVFTGSLHALDRQVRTGESGGPWVSVGPDVQELEAALRAPAGPRADRLQAALGELAALDEILAGLTATLGLETAAAAR